MSAARTGAQPVRDVARTPTSSCATCLIIVPTCDPLPAHILVLLTHSFVEMRTAAALFRACPASSSASLPAGPALSPVCSRSSSSVCTLALEPSDSPIWLRVRVQFRLAIGVRVLTRRSEQERDNCNLQSLRVLV